MPRLSETEQVQAKIGYWKQAFDAVRADFNASIPGMRDLLLTLQSQEAMRDLPLYIQLARVVSANDRAAATVAALLTATGIKPTALNYGDDE
jgi:hypothetical protein